MHLMAAETDMEERAIEIATKLEEAGRAFVAGAPHGDRGEEEIRAYLDMRDQLLASLGKLNLPSIKGASRDRLRGLLVQVREHDEAVIRAAGAELQELRSQLDRSALGRRAARGYASTKSRIDPALDRDA